MFSGRYHNNTIDLKNVNEKEISFRPENIFRIILDKTSGDSYNEVNHIFPIKLLGN